MASKLIVESAYAGNANDQFRIASDWLSLEKFSNAERWLRYAALQQHIRAQIVLKEGINNGKFLSTGCQLNSISLGILETLVIPKPSQRQLDDMSTTLKYILHRDFRFDTDQS